MTTLARKLRLVDYFVLAFGVMVGTAWLVVMDDILQRGGPLGAILGFLAGALMLLPIGYVYGQLVRAIPDAGGEAAYVARFYPRPIVFVTGWMVLLSYFLTCPFEALAAGRIAGYLFPPLNAGMLYRVGGHPVYLPHIVLGWAIAIALSWLNIRGIQASARVARWITFTFLFLVVVFAGAGAQHGKAANLRPLFSHSPLLSMLLVWQVVPWLLAGFESVGKYAEEASPDFRSSDFSVAILITILVGLAFFCLVISAVAYVAPWPTLQSNREFPTAVAFERGLHAHWIVIVIMTSAIFALLQAFNANLVAASRMLFALSRRRLLSTRFSRLHERNQIPDAAIICVAVATAAAMFLGEAGLVPILEVGALASSVAWMAACAAYWRMEPASKGRLAAGFGLLVTTLMVLVKLVPLVPGHFSKYEWLALGIWLGLGALARITAGSQELYLAEQASARGGHS